MLRNPATHCSAARVPENQVYLERPQIDDILDDALHSPMVTVTAGTGYGKTHSVYSYLRKRAHRTLWVQLSPRDNIVNRFWDNFTRALALLNAKAAAELAKLGFPATDPQFERFLDVLQKHVDPALEKYIFVFDDLHLLENKSALEFLEKCITLPYPNVTTVFISRKEPPFNMILHLSKGALVEITEEQLRFSWDEMAEYFQLLGINAPKETLDAAYRDTEGWAFAIHLVGLYLKKSAPGRFYTSHVIRSNIFKLIESEVVMGVSPELRRFLIKLTLLDHLAPELIEQLDEGAREMVEQMKSMGSFVYFDTYQNTWQIHRLLAEYLSGFQDELLPAEKKAVWRKAAEWSASVGQAIDAISYYSRSGNFDKVSEQVYTLPMAIPDKDAEFLLDLMRQLPKETYESQPLAWVILIRLLLSTGNIEEANEKLTEVIAKYEPQEASPTLNRLLFGCYTHLGFLRKLRCLADRNYDFAECFAKALHYKSLWGGEISGPMTIASIGTYACRAGTPNPDDMEAFIAEEGRMVAQTAAAMHGCMWGQDCVSRGEVHFFRMDMDGAESYLREATARARQKNQYEVESQALFYLMRIAAFQGNHDAIIEIHERLEHLLTVEEYLNRYIYNDIFRGWFYAHLGATEKLARWLRGETGVPRLNTHIKGQDLLIRAKALLRERNHPATLAVLNYSKANVGTFIFGKVEIAVMESVTLYQMQNRPAAYGKLKEAYDLAQPAGLFLPFVEWGKDMRALTEAALRDNAPIPREFLEKIRLQASAYAKKFFRIAERFPFAKNGADEPGKPQRAHVDLSPKEMEMLQELFRGFTLGEISEEKNLSVNTVKSIIQRIYTKLGASNRTDALRIAASRGLLKQDVTPVPYPPPPPPRFQKTIS
ncbi:MAG: LuxR C-terminal-related transcriptional regulator [Acidobacteriota bacterium]|jgi:LuxR family maltose regulon positive regulatory protein|nr:LuxR C-terminal-related transcriptional regulator [Acidobacteriota bacterium]